MITYKPTPKQAMATALITSGIEPGKAMIQAGFSRTTARNPKKNLLDKPQVKPIIEQFQNELKKQGLTIEYRVSKLKRFLEADKKDPDNYDIQIQALKMLNDLDNIKPDKDKDLIKRTVMIGIEEFEEKEGILNERNNN